MILLVVRDFGEGGKRVDALVVGVGGPVGQVEKHEHHWENDASDDVDAAGGGPVAGQPLGHQVHMRL